MDKAIYILLYLYVFFVGIGIGASITSLIYSMKGDK